MRRGTNCETFLLTTLLELVDAHVIILRDKWLWSAGTTSDQPACLLCYSAWLSACLLRGHYLWIRGGGGWWTRKRRWLKQQQQQQHSKCKEGDGKVGQRGARQESHLTTMNIQICCPVCDDGEIDTTMIKTRQKKVRLQTLWLESRRAGNGNWQDGENVV